MGDEMQANRNVRETSKQTLESSMRSLCGHQTTDGEAVMMV